VLPLNLSHRVKVRPWGQNEPEGGTGLRGRWNHEGVGDRRGVGDDSKHGQQFAVAIKAGVDGVYGAARQGVRVCV